jgi:hypothetical protein
VTNTTKKNSPGDARKPGVKKPYRPPTFRFEHVFEVSALSCGKISATQGACHQVPKAS